MWVVGIDEAGYGPNLGPFVMSAVRCQVPGPAPSCLWECLAPAVRRAGSKRDARLIIDDSKRVYSSGKTLAGLERGLTALLGSLPPTLDDLVARLAPADHADVREEIWYTGATALPTVTAEPDRPASLEAFASACTTAELGEWTVRSVVVCTPRFNRLIDRAGTKSMVLADAFVRLLQECVETHPDEEIVVTADKQGGRNTYHMQIQQAVGGLVRIVEESEEQSIYEVPRESGLVRVCFTPRADGANLCVAAASMVSKYLRELFMHEFNAFWCGKVPGLAPTAGYPGDAPRYLEAITSQASELGVPRAALWRER
jgi:ribonuclease HII